VPLITVSMTVKTVLHSAKVAHIPHESRLSLVARHPLIRRSTFTHFRGVCQDITTRLFQWLNLVCSALAEVIPEVSVQNHQGPPLASCGFQESPLHYPLVPIQADRRESTLPAPLIGTPNMSLPHTTQGRTHIG
jgi:hypothetical protein